MKITWQLKRVADGWEGVIRVYVNPGAVDGGKHTDHVAHGPNKGTALARAAGVAERAVEAMERHPEAAMLLPPGVVPALAGIKAIAKSGALGRAREAFNHLSDIPGMHGLTNLARVL